MTPAPLPPAPRPALRIVHLTGGLRAYDFGDLDIRVGPDFGRHLLTIPTQPYDRAFSALQSIGLETLGVDFITNAAPLSDLQPPDFQIFTPGTGFVAMANERAWSDVKNVPGQNTPEILDIAARFTTYHALLTLRIRDVSEAYRRCLLMQLTEIDGKYAPPEHGRLFSNGFRTYIEAATHAFLADAAGLRDLIAEAIWRLILKRPARDVTTLSATLKRTRGTQGDHPLLAELHGAAGDGGWLKGLTDLRNAIIHIAPLGATHEMHFMQLRMKPLTGGAVPIVHYPLTTADGRVRLRTDPIDFKGEEQVKERLETYRAFVNDSGDALAYASRIAVQLVDLASRVRAAAGLRHQMLHITDADIIGKIRVFKGGVEELSG